MKVQTDRTLSKHDFMMQQSPLQSALTTHLPAANHSHLEPLLPMPFLFPPRKPRTLIQRPDLPIPRHPPLLLLLALVLLQRRHDDVLGMPRVLVLHEILLALLQHLEQQTRHVRLVAELADGGEDGGEVEDDGARQRQPTQRLPVDAQVHARDVVPRVLGVAQLFVRVPGRHEERFVDFETPGAALDGFVRGFLGEVAGRCQRFSMGLILRLTGKERGKGLPVHGEFHLLLVVGNRFVDLVEFQSDLGSHVPPEGATDQAGAEMIDAIFGIAEHDGEVFGDIVQESLEWCRLFEVGLGLENVIVEDGAVAV